MAAVTAVVTKGRCIIHIARQPRTGVWSMMRELARWQVSQGYRVVFGLLLPATWPVSYHHQLEEMRAEGVRVFTRDSPDVFGTAAYLFHQFSNPMVDWALKVGQPDTTTVMHFHNAWLSGAYMPIKVPSVTTVVTYHGIQGERQLSKQPIRRFIHARWAKRLSKYGVRHASVDLHNTYVAERLFGVDARSFTVIPNGTASPPAGLRGAPHLRDRSLPFTVGHVGFVDEGKGWRITAEAIKKLHMEGQHVRYLIAGDGPQIAQAKSWCEAHSDFAEFLGHLRNPLVEVFPRLDVMALPSRGEGLPMAVLEAFSLGVPVVATAVGGLAQLIQNSENGFLVDRSSEAVASALLRLIVNPDLHILMSQQSRDVHKQRYSSEVMGAAYESLYFEERPESKWSARKDIDEGCELSLSGIPSSLVSQARAGRVCQ